jgi:hypothetical protein
MEVYLLNNMKEFNWNNDKNQQLKQKEDLLLMILLRQSNKEIYWM